MTVIRPTSITGITSLTCTSDSLAIHNSSGALIQNLVSGGITTVTGLTASGISTLTGGINIGTAATIFANGNATFSGITTSAGSSVQGRLLVNQSSNYTVYGDNKLQISATDGTAGLSVTRWSANGSSPYINLGKSRGAEGAYTVVQDGDRLGQINFVGADGTDLASHAASIAAYVDGTPGSNDMPGRLVFATSSDGGVAETERLRITSAGYSCFTGSAGINTTSPNRAFTIYSDATTRMNLKSQANSTVGLEFGDPADENIGYIVYDNSTDYMGFGVNAGERLRIASSGQLGIGGANYGTDGQVLTSAGSGAAVAWEDVAGGITMADQWRVTADFQANADPIASNWEQADNYGLASMGSAMTQSSGVFTFPATGYYLVYYTGNVTTQYTPAQPHSHRNTFGIKATTNNSTYYEVAASSSGIYNYGSSSYPSHGTATTGCIFDVTNTTNCKMSFYFGAGQGSETCKGGTNANYTFVTFVRLGDT